jgi:hypothetical protein
MLLSTTTLYVLLYVPLNTLLIFFPKLPFSILPRSTSLHLSILHFTPHTLRPHSASSCLLLPSVSLFYFLIPTLFYLFLPFLSSTSSLRVLVYFFSLAFLCSAFLFLLFLTASTFHISLLYVTFSYPLFYILLLAFSISPHAQFIV